MMTRARFAELAETWGADLRLWPAAERAAARALLDVSAEARLVLEREKRLDMALDAVPPPPPPAAALAPRLGALAVREPRSLWAEITGLFGGWHMAGAALAACIAVGVLLGAAVPVAPVAQPSTAADASLLTYAILTDSYLDH